MEAFLLADQADKLLQEHRFEEALTLYEAALVAPLPEGEDPKYWASYWSAKVDALEDILHAEPHRPQPAAILVLPAGSEHRVISLSFVNK